MKLAIVTSTADSGTGTFREALETEGPVLIAPATSGEVHLDSDLVIDRDDVYMAGQTAPWPGIMFRGATIRIKSSRVTFEHFHVWPGYNPDLADNLDCVSIETGTFLEDVTVRNCSLAFSTDEALVCWGSGANGHMTDIKLTDNLVYHPLVNGGHRKGHHNYGVLLGAHCGYIEFARNLVAHCGKRMPVQQGDTQLRMYNNVAYNWGSEGLHINDDDGPTTSDIWCNVIKPGRNSKHQDAAKDYWSLRVKLRNPASLLSLIDNGIIGGGTLDVQSATLEQNESPRPPHVVSPRLTEVLVASVAGPKYRNAHDEQVIKDMLENTGGFVDAEEDLGPLLKVRPPSIGNLDHHPAFGDYDPDHWREWLAQF